MFKKYFLKLFFGDRFTIEVVRTSIHVIDRLQRSGGQKNRFNFIITE